MSFLQMEELGARQAGNVVKKTGRRSHLEIRMAVLKVIMNGADGPTQIMYGANLSWMLLCEHLKALVELKFVEEKVISNRKKYSLSTKGVDVIQSYLSVVREILTDSAQRA